MEKQMLQDGENDIVSKSRERSLFMPVLGVLTIVFTGAFVSAFLFTNSNIKTLSATDGTLRRQIEILRMKVEYIKQNIKDGTDGTELFSDEEVYEEILGEFSQKTQEEEPKKRQVQAVSFIDAVLRAQELVFEKYCHDHNATCPSGPVGDKGIHGANGTDGVVTGNVTNGVVGPPGNKGSQGEPGIQGMKGPVGNKGDFGDVGLKGGPGIQGAQGVDGDNGTVGIMGDTGGKGVQGEWGLKGDLGDTGLSGVDGYIGLPGGPGANGTMGQQGPIGDTGLPGLKGKTTRFPG